MMGVSTHIPGSPSGVINHTPIDDLFSSAYDDRIWFEGTNVVANNAPVELSEEEMSLVDEIMELVTIHFPQYPRAHLRLITRTLPSYPLSCWPDSPIGRGNSRSSPTTHGILVCVIPTGASSAGLLQYFRTTQPFNHVHCATNVSTLLCLHLTSTPGREEDKRILCDILRDFRRGWKKNLIKIDQNHSQRIWTRLSDGRHVRPVASYNDIASRPFEDATLDP